jgi:ABC-2 type transport system ATP-binding protein
MISLAGVTKRYGKRRGIEAVDLAVGQGEIFGFLGPNGAGKTTTIRVLLGFLRATAGTAHILGYDSWSAGHVARRDVGYLPGDLRLYPWFTARSGLNVVSRIRGKPVGEVAAALLHRFDLDPDVPVRKMSRGTRQKLGLLLTLAHAPRLIVLDEPTSALDPLVRDELSRILRERAAGGATVFFSSHTLSDVESLCDRIAIVRDGRIVADETLAALRARATREVVIRFRDSELASSTASPAGLRVHERAGPVWHAELVGEPAGLVAFLHAVNAVDFTVGAPDLQGIFRSYYREEG